MGGRYKRLQLVEKHSLEILFVLGTDTKHQSRMGTKLSSPGHGQEQQGAKGLEDKFSRQRDKEDEMREDKRLVSVCRWREQGSGSCGRPGALRLEAAICQLTLGRHGNQNALRRVQSVPPQ
ncbi:hypothetical protein GBF38_017562, partial [Nibea albiflora]